MCKSATPNLFDLPFPGRPDLILERKHAALFGNRLAGVDEAGRGPWAGPVVTAAVVLDYDALPEGLNDSKQLSESRRETLFAEICQSSHVSIASASARLIDQVNIRVATLSAMTRSVQSLAIEPEMVLVDGRDVPPGLEQPGQSLIKGDGRCLAIAAASIVAKVFRDRLMKQLDKIVPGYGFAQHKGYGVPAHLAALKELGPTPYHRMSFKPIMSLSSR